MSRPAFVTLLVVIFLTALIVSFGCTHIRELPRISP